MVAVPATRAYLFECELAIASFTSPAVREIQDALVNEEPSQKFEQLSCKNLKRENYSRKFPEPSVADLPVGVIQHIVAVNADHPEKVRETLCRVVFVCRVGCQAAVAG